MKIITDLFRKKTRFAGKNDAFVTLVRVARENPEIGRQLQTLLSLERFHRKSALNTYLEQLWRKQAPPEFIAAIEVLLDDKVADRLSDLLASTG